MKTIQILGTGCPKCRKLAENAAAAAEALGVPYRLEKVSDIHEIMSLGVMLTPGIAIDGVVKASGKVSGRDEITEWLK